MPVEPTRDHVLAWLLAVPGRQPGDAVDKVWPALDDNDRRRVGSKVRMWLSRAKAGGPPRPPAGDPEVELQDDNPDATPTGPHPSSALDRTAFLVEQLGLLMRDAETARSAGMLRAIPALDARIAAVRLALDETRANGMDNELLDASPMSVAHDMIRRWQQISGLADCMELAKTREEQELDALVRDWELAEPGSAHRQNPFGRPVSDPANRRGVRWVPMPPDLRHQLEEWRDTNLNSTETTP